MVRVQGIGKLDLALRNCQLHDNAGSAFRAETNGTAALTLGITDSRFERFGRTAIELAARDSAHASFQMGRSIVAIPAVTDAPAIDVATADSAIVCADLFGNGISTGSAQTVRLSPAVTACH
jgi:hypothetical protein